MPSMAPGFDHIDTCLAVRDEDLLRAATSSADARALIERMASVARPNQGAARILSVLSRVATSEWIEGDMRVEVGGDADVTVIDVMIELAGGFCERLWPRLAVHVPLDELRRAVKMQPKFIEPLRLKHDRPSRLVLAVAADLRFSSLPPPSIEVGEEAWPWGQRSPKPEELAAAGRSPATLDIPPAPRAPMNTAIGIGPAPPSRPRPAAPEQARSVRRPPPPPVPKKKPSKKPPSKG